MKRLTALRVIAVASLVLAACGGGGSSDEATPDDTATPNAATTDEPSDEPADEFDVHEAAPYEPETAWEAVLAGVEADGTVPLDTALQAFALQFGSIPGVEVPEGATGDADPSGTGALAGITAHEDELTDAQREAIAAALAPVGTDGTPLPRTEPKGQKSSTTTAKPAAATASNRYEMQLIGTRRPARSQLLGGEVSCTFAGEHITEDQTGTEEYRALVDGELGRVEQVLGESLSIPVYLSLGVAKEGSETLAWASPQSTHCKNDLATSCHVQILYNTFDQSSEGDARATIAHELTHCFQATWLPPYASLTAPQWLSEGFAEFVGHNLHPGGPRTNFQIYVKTPYKPLFARSYDAQGFYFHLKTIGSNAARRFKAAFQAQDNMQAFQQMTAPAGSRFDNTWGSVLAFDDTRGSDWYMPEAPAGSKGQYIDTAVANGSRIRLDAGEVSNYLEHVSFSADIVKINVGSGTHGRVGWDGRSDELLSSVNDRLYCARAEGCECPEGSTGSGPSARIPSSSALFAVTSTGDAAAVELIGASMGDICKLKEKDPKIDPCVIGTWVSSEFTLPGPAGLDGVGGADAVMVVRADGHTTWNFNAMQPVTVEDEQIDVTTSQYSNGQTEGFVAAKNGTWDVSGDFSGVEAWMEDNIIGRSNLAGGPGLFVGALDGGYTCSGDTLSYTTEDPVERKTVSVLLHKQ